jgi:hypothetical protein
MSINFKDKDMVATYKAWDNMKRRCLNPSCRSYKYYGARGINVCDRWLDSFDNFLADMGKRQGRKELDRIDNDGDYTPGNCRWATKSEQSRNKRCKGYTFNKYHNKYEARCKRNGFKHFIGYYDTADEAHEAYLAFKQEIDVEKAVI